MSKQYTYVYKYKYISISVVIPPSMTELKATLVWDDQAQSVSNPTYSGPSCLLNDLDLSVYDPSGRKYYPFSNNPDHPSDDAWTTGTNTRDNIEQVRVDVSTTTPSSIWTVEIKGTLFRQTSYGQDRTLVVNAPPASILDDARNPNYTHVYVVNDEYGNAAAKIDADGNLFLEGNFTCGYTMLGTYSTGGPDWTRGNGNRTLAYVECHDDDEAIGGPAIGDMRKIGNVFENTILEHKVGNSLFEVRNANNEVVALLDIYGDLYLKGWVFPYAL